MHITSLRVSNLLSFGPEQVFEQFSRFNLFIGKNGAGKSNLLRLIGKLPVESGSLSAEEYLPSGVYIEASAVNRNRRHLTGPEWRGGELSIDYQRPLQLGVKDTEGSIVFRAGQLVQGDFFALQKKHLNFGATSLK